MFERILKKNTSEHGAAFECVVPESLRSGYRKGLYRVEGAMVKSMSTGRIIGHLQQTSSDGSLDLGQIFSTVFQAAGIASSLLNLGVSVITLHKINRMSQQLESIEQRLGSIERRLGSIEQKLESLILDKLLNSFAELKEIERTHLRVIFELEEQAREGEASNIRRNLSRISAVFVNEFNKAIESDELNAEFCVPLIEALGLHHQMYVFTLLATSQFQAIEGFGQREVEQIRNFIGCLENKTCPVIRPAKGFDYPLLVLQQTTLKSVFGSTELFESFRAEQEKEAQKEVQKEADKWENKRRLIIECCESAVLNLESLTSLVDTLRRRNVSGERYFELLAQSAEMGPVVFVPAPETAGSR